MAQKTAMMELIEKLHSIKNDKDFIAWLMLNAEQLLKKEKEQIIDAAKETIHLWMKGDVILGEDAGEQYYNETYKQD